MRHPASTLAAALAALAACALVVTLGVRVAGAEPADLEDALRERLQVERAEHREEVAEVRRRLAAGLEAQAARHARHVAGLRRTIAQRPHVRHALRLAATTTGVPLAELRAVARCESEGDPGAVNGESGAGGVMQFLRSTWYAYRFGRAGWSRFDPYANAMQAALIVQGEGWRQWVCKP